MKKLSLFVYSGLGVITIFVLFLCCKPLAINDVAKQQKEQLIPTNLKWSERMALSIMKRHPKAWQIDNHEKPKWDYKIGMILTAYEKLYNQTKEQKYFDYIKDYADILIDSTGSFQNFNPNDYNIDFINAGKILFNLYDTTKEQKYLNALKTLRNQFVNYPRTASGGFWHKEIYPNQMWLDGLYMGQPFYARYTAEFENGAKLDDVVHQFELLRNHAFDKETGTAPHIWLRALGWYGMALVDVLDYFPKEHPKRAQLIAYLNELATGVQKYQDASGLWYQVPNLPKRAGNYLEASGSSMFVYAIAKGVHKGYLPAKFNKVAVKGFDGLTKELIKVDSNGELHITQVCGSAGLGGNPYRDGSFEYYMSEKIKVDNSHGLGAFLLAAIELKK